MPKIPYEARSFPSGIPLWSPTSTMPSLGNANATRSEIYSHAVSVGVPWGQTWWNSFGHSHPAFQRINLTWRGTAVDSCLVEDNGYWALDPAFDELDGSEKAFLSYLMGMTQASLMAEHVLGALAMVHVDAVLRLLGKLDPKKKRPDLIGFHRGSTAAGQPAPVPPGRVLMEAKGTSSKKTTQVVSEALLQIKPPTPLAPNSNLQTLGSLLGPNAMRAISVSHFQAPPGTPTGGAVWSSYLEDPPHEGPEEATWDDGEFLGLLVLAKLLPLYVALESSPIESFDWPVYIDGATSTYQLDDHVLIGIPSQFISLFDEYLSTEAEAMRSDDHRLLRRLCQTLAHQVVTPARLAPKARLKVDGWEHSRQRSGLSLALNVE